MSIYVFFVLGLPVGLLLGWLVGWFGVPVKRPSPRKSSSTTAVAAVAVTPTRGALSTPPPPPSPLTPTDEVWSRPTPVAPPGAARASESEGVEATVGISTFSVDSEPIPSAPSAASDSSFGADEPRQAGEDDSPARLSDDPPADEAIVSMLGEAGALDVEQVEGIGRVYARRLRDAGITSVAALFAAASTDYRRRKLADELRISRKLILRWVNHADLMRLDGVNTQFAELLEAAGVDSPTELQHRVPAHLIARMAEVDAEKHVVPGLPDESTVAAWIEAAKALPKIVSH